MRRTLSLERAAFLRNLGSKIILPVMPNQETLEYLPTQAIADFLATENDPPLDGIIFRSVQAGEEGINVVLFHKAARVEDIDLPMGTTVKARLGYIGEDGWEEEYSVVEETQPKKEEPENQPSLELTYAPLVFFDDLGQNDLFGSGPATLRIDLKSIRVHVVESVQFTTRDQGVNRYRLEQSGSEPPF